MSKDRKTIDLTPSWKSLVPLFVEWLHEGTASQRAIAIKHLNQMAEVMDQLMKHKGHILSCDKCEVDFEL